jgi:hypothetical protein
MEPLRETGRSAAEGLLGERAARDDSRPRHFAPQAVRQILCLQRGFVPLAAGDEVPDQVVSGLEPLLIIAAMAGC